MGGKGNTYVSKCGTFDTSRKGLRRNSTNSYVAVRNTSYKNKARDVKTYRGLRRRGEQRHGAGVLRPLLLPISVGGHGRFAERQYLVQRYGRPQPASQSEKQKEQKSRNNKDFPSKTADDCTCTMTRACYSDTNVPVLISRRRKAEGTKWQNCRIAEWQSRLRVADDGKLKTSKNRKARNASAGD